jgi:hypothetical protein
VGGRLIVWLDFCVPAQCMATIVVVGGYAAGDIQSQVISCLYYLLSWFSDELLSFVVIGELTVQRYRNVCSWHL